MREIHTELEKCSTLWYSSHLIQGPGQAPWLFIASIIFIWDWSPFTYSKCLVTLVESMDGWINRTMTLEVGSGLTLKLYLCSFSRALDWALALFYWSHCIIHPQNKTPRDSSRQTISPCHRLDLASISTLPQVCQNPPSSMVHLIDITDQCVYSVVIIYTLIKIWWTPKLQHRLKTTDLLFVEIPIHLISPEGP